MSADLSGVSELDEAQLERSLGEQLRRYDKGGEQFYDTISRAAQIGARQRSGCGAVLVRGGCSTGVSIRATRRVGWCAWPARTSDWPTAGAAAGTRCHRNLRAARVARGRARAGASGGLLAMAPKSNAVYRAYKAARAFVAQDGTRAVPLRLQQCAHAVDERPRLRARLPLRARRRRWLRPRVRPTGRRCSPAQAVPARGEGTRDPHRRASGRAASNQ